MDKIKYTYLSYLLCFLFGFITSFFLLQSTFILSAKTNFGVTNGIIRNHDPYLGEFDMIIIVFSAPENIVHRNAIRKTWQKLLDKHVKLYYIIGTMQLPKDTHASLIKEKQTHNDIILLPDITDSYNNLANKLLRTVLHLNRYFDFIYMVKVDDDSLIHLPHLKSYLQKLPHKEKLYLGFFDGRAKPKKGGRWEENKWFLCDHYLPYTLGGGYVLTKDIVSIIASIAEHVSLYSSEDISLGVWLAPFNINRIHEPLFDTEYKSRGCNNRYLITHKQTPILMAEKYKSLLESNRMCLEEIQERKSYIYNWNVPPSRCCIRNDSTLP